MGNTHLTKLTEERTHIFNKKLRLFQRRKVPATWHFGEALHVHAPLRPFAGELRFAREERNGCRRCAALFLLPCPVT